MSGDALSLCTAGAAMAFCAAGVGDEADAGVAALADEGLGVAAEEGAEVGASEEEEAEASMDWVTGLGPAATERRQLREGPQDQPGGQQ